MHTLEEIILAIASMTPHQRIMILNFAYNYRRKADQQWRKFFISYSPEHLSIEKHDKVKITGEHIEFFRQAISDMWPEERLEVVKAALNYGSETEHRHLREILYENAYTGSLNELSQFSKDEHPEMRLNHVEQYQQRNLVCYFEGETVGLQKGPCNFCRTKRTICIVESPFRVHLGPLLDDLASIGRESLARSIESVPMESAEDLMVVWFLLRDIRVPNVRVSRLKEYLTKLDSHRAMERLYQRLPSGDHESIPAFMACPFPAHRHATIVATDEEYPDVEIEPQRWLSYKTLKSALEKKRATWQPLLTNTILDSSQPGGGSECLYIGDPRRGIRYQYVQTDTDHIPFPQLALILDYHESNREFNFHFSCNHLCGNDWCGNLRHLRLESPEIERSCCMINGLGKSFCNGCGSIFGSCPHSPECLKFKLIPGCEKCLHR